MRGILQGIELFEMLGAPNQDTITGRGPLERAEALDQEQMLPFGDNGPLRPPYVGAPWRSAPVSRNPSYVYECTREAQRGPREDLLPTYVESP